MPTLDCPACKTTLAIPENAAGQSFRCPKCSASINPPHNGIPPPPPRTHRRIPDGPHPDALADFFRQNLPVIRLLLWVVAGLFLIGCAREALFDTGSARSVAGMIAVYTLARVTSFAIDEVAKFGNRRVDG